MPANIKIATQIPPQYRNAAGRVNTVLVQAHKRATSDSMNILREAIRASGAIATFDLYNSVRDRLRARASRSAWYTREIYFIRPADKYWQFADRGREAGKMPPIAPLLRWAAALNLPPRMAWAVRWIIGEEGTEGHNFMRMARPLIKRRARQVMAEALREIRRIFKGRQ
jgi:hypothetical protein